MTDLDAVPGERSIPLDADWLFGGLVASPLPEDWPDDEVAAAASRVDLDDSAFAPVVLPHTVAPLSWRQWDPDTWEGVWTYRRHLTLGDVPAGRLFLDFEAVMTNATVTLNGQRLGRHQGGYLPFSFEVTDVVQAGDNVLAVLVDARFNLDVPPNIPSPVRSEAVDYWQPGGIYGRVALRCVPMSYVRDLVVVPREVLDPERRTVDVSAVVDSRGQRPAAQLHVALQDLGGLVLSRASTQVPAAAGSAEVTLKLTGLAAADLWDVDTPVLYTVTATLVEDEQPVHASRARTGFREARFERDGFYLNGRRLYLFGANRHQHYPFAGFAMPARVQRRDAEILRHELNCVFVRCSHYPQLPAFLDACDELGLLVWEEAPGWQYVGGPAWQDRVVADVTAMVLRDRNRPSVVVWGARLNETPDHPLLYARTEAVVKRLDPTRATSGTTYDGYHATTQYQHDVFSYDDYTIAVLPDGDRRPGLRPPRDDLPYLVAETVTSWSSPVRLYRRADPPVVQQHQAMDYAYVHEVARADPRYTGVIAWSGFDYQAGHAVNSRGMKTSGLYDTFRVRKPGAAMYVAQVPADRRVVLEPAFTWDPPVERQTSAAGDNRTPGDTWGPGAAAVVFTNCERVEAYVGGEHRASARPDREGFPHLVTPPTVLDLRVRGREPADLRLEGYLGDRLVVVRELAGDRSGDHVTVVADDEQIVADGVDATRVEIAVVDRFGEKRGSSEARLAIEVSGPGVLVGEPVLDLGETGAVGAVWVRSLPDRPGMVAVLVSHPDHGSVGATVRSVSAD